MAFQLKDKVSRHIKSSNTDQKVGLITQVESALGLLNLRDVLNHATKQDLPFDLQGIIFGSDDFLVSIGEPNRSWPNFFFKPCISSLIEIN